MTDDKTNGKKSKLAKELRKELTEAEALERDLDRLFSTLEPPYGAQDRLMARLQPVPFSERDLVLDADPAGPYSFEEAQAQQQAEDDATGSDLLAAGLEEEPIENIEKPVQPDTEDDDSNA